VSELRGDIALIGIILQAISAGQLPELKQHSGSLERLRTRLRDGDQAAADELCDLMKGDSLTQDRVISAVTQIALSFVTDAVAHFRKVRSSRCFTDEEAGYGEHLSEILLRLAALYGEEDGASHPGDKGGGTNQRTNQSGQDSLM